MIGSIKELFSLSDSFLMTIPYISLSKKPAISAQKHGGIMPLHVKMGIKNIVFFWAGALYEIISSPQFKEKLMYSIPN